MPGWAEWNYAGLEGKEAQPAGCDAAGSTVPCTTGGWPEYRDLMATMAALGEDPEHGCGRAFWEYDSDRLEGYGTPMAPMLLPYFTDGCIGSQEGLYFESSATVPYHFLMQSELSASPRRPSASCRTRASTSTAGVRHLQLLGVKYYLAVTPHGGRGRRGQHPDLTEVAVSGPWHVYEVADAAAGRRRSTYEPVVAEGMGESQDGWLPTAVGLVPRPRPPRRAAAIDGPDDVEAGRRPTRSPDDWRRLVRWTREQLGETGPMDQVPDEPRTGCRTRGHRHRAGRRHDLVRRVRTGRPGPGQGRRTSRTGRSQGADGPYRVTPNLMVVVPTARARDA